MNLHPKPGHSLVLPAATPVLVPAAVPLAQGLPLPHQPFLPCPQQSKGAERKLLILYLKAKSTSILGEGKGVLGRVAGRVFFLIYEKKKARN